MSAGLTPHEGVTPTFVAAAIYRQETQPEGEFRLGDRWIDISTDPPSEYQWTIRGWELVTSGGGGGSIKISAGTTSNLMTQVTFGDGGGVSFGLAGSVITAVAPAAGGGLTNIRVSAGTTSNLLSALTFSNANGVSFGLNASTLTGSVTPQSVQTQNMVSVQGSTGPISFSNSNGITFGFNASTITASHNGITQQSTQPVAVSGQNGSYAFSTLSFSNANGISFGTSAGSAVTASHNALTSQSIQTQNMVSVVGSTGNISFDNGNGVTFGFNNSTITASHNGLTSQSNQALSAANGSFAFQTAQFSNANGVSFVTSAGSAIAASVETSYAASNHSHGNPTLFLTNLSGTTDSNSAGFTLSLSALAGGGGADGGNTLAAGTRTAGSNSVVFFSDSNGISWGLNAPSGSVMTASYTVPAVTNSSWTVSDAGTSGTVARLAFTNLNGVTLSLSTGAAGSHTIVGSHNALTSQSNQNVTAANGGFAFQTLSFSNLNGVSFGTSAGSAITASHNGLTSQSNQAWSGSNASSTFQTLSFNNANGVSWSNNAGAVEASYTRPVVSNALQSVGSATGSGTNTSRFAADDHVHAGVFSFGISTAGNTAGDTRVDVGRFVLQGGNNITLSQVTAANALNTIVVSAGAGGGVNPVASASNGSFSFTTLGFSNANNVTFGTSAGSIITASVAPPGAAAENNAIDLLGANTSGNTTATGSTIGWSGINITLSGTNNSVVNISAPATSSLVGATGLAISTAGSTISIYQLPASRMDFIPTGLISSSQQTNSQISFRKLEIFEPISFTRVDLPIDLSIASSANANTGNIVFTSGCVIYTRNGSTLNPIVGSTGSTTYTWASNTANYSSVIGGRYASWGLATALTPGEYWIAFHLSTTNNSSIGTATTQLANTISVLAGSIFTARNFAEFGSTTGASSNGLRNLQGLCSISISNTTMTFQQSQITVSGVQGFRANVYCIFRNY